MLAEYVEYLKNINARLKREGVVLPVDLNCDAAHLGDQVTVLEQFLYFNHVMQVSGSAFVVEDMVGFHDIGVDEYLRSQIYEKYQSEWARQLASLTAQPEDAGEVSKPVQVLDSSMYELFHNSLGLISQEHKEEAEEIPAWKMQFGTSGSGGFLFDEEPEPEPDDDGMFDEVPEAAEEEQEPDDEGMFDELESSISDVGSGDGAADDDQFDDSDAEYGVDDGNPWVFDDEESSSEDDDADSIYGDSYEDSSSAEVDGELADYDYEAQNSTQSVVVSDEDDDGGIDFEGYAEDSEEIAEDEDDGGIDFDGTVDSGIDFGGYDSDDEEMAEDDGGIDFDGTAEEVSDSDDEDDGGVSFDDYGEEVSEEDDGGIDFGDGTEDDGGVYFGEDDGGVDFGEDDGGIDFGSDEEEVEDDGGIDFGSDEEEVEDDGGIDFGDGEEDDGGIDFGSEEEDDGGIDFGSDEEEIDESEEDDSGIDFGDYDESDEPEPEEEDDGGVDFGDDEDDKSLDDYFDEYSDEAVRQMEARRAAQTPMTGLSSMDMLQVTGSSGVAATNPFASSDKQAEQVAEVANAAVNAVINKGLSALWKAKRNLGS